MIKLARIEHWQLHLDALLSSRLRTPFEWGVFDCTVFAADAVQALTGVDLAEGHRGYRGARAALRMLDRAGGVAMLASRYLGMPRHAPDARIGDVTLSSVDARGREALGVVITTSSFVVPAARGLVQLPLSMARNRWAVG